MSQVFKPRLDILPAEQRALWPQLRNVPELGFTLYGGTALALRLGHRASVDFDFFSTGPIDRDAIRAALPFIRRATTLQDQPDSWVLLTSASAERGGGVKISFFGGISFGRVGEPEFTEDGVLRVASLDDLMATKVKVVLQRAEAKDYRDVAAMLTAGVSLSRALASARLMFGENFQPSESIKALAYFSDGDLDTLSTADRTILINAAKGISDDLPEVLILDPVL